MYSIGNKFRINRRSYVLASIGNGEVILINLGTGERWANRHRVNKLYTITISEMNSMLKESIDDDDTTIEGITVPYPVKDPLELLKLLSISFNSLTNSEKDIEINYIIECIKEERNCSFFPKY